MFTPSGQPELLHRAAFGGGKGGGGGGGWTTPPAPPVYTDPVTGQAFNTTDDLNAEIKQRTADAATKSAADKATADAKAASDETAFQGNKQGAYNQAMQSVMRAFQLQGADPAQYMDTDIKPALQRAMSSIKDLDPNPGAAFPTTMGDSIANQILGGKRTGALNSLNQTFSPTYSASQLSDSILDPYVSSTVNAQFDPLMAQLTNAQKRGTLTGAGYQGALDLYNQDKAKATSTVTNLGQGILAKDRSGLDDYISGARSDANALTLGGNFDPSSYSNTAAGKVQSYKDTFGGALQNAVGDTKFATIGDLINAGGAIQGATNPNAANPTAGGAVNPDALDPTAQQKRGLGSTGSF